MSRTLTFFILALLLLPTSEGRLSSSTTRKESDPHKPFSSNIPTGSSPEESSMNDDDCTGPGSEECLMRRSMVDHTDYIYTQDVNGP